MARARKAVETPPEEPLTDSERQEAEESAKGPKPAEPEVRPEEFEQGMAAPAWTSPLPENVVRELRDPLDPNRVRRRAGRGGGQYEYLAGHDAKRRANEIFGPGNWAYKVVSLRESAAVEVQGSGNKPGWHISYEAVVEMMVRDCLPFSDVGYGDGVEYGPAALATARELASKEAVTDAMKRAMTGWGDQFGLILYAKDDEKKRISRDQNAAEAKVVRVDAPQRTPPQNWTEAIARFDKLVAEEGQGEAWLEELVEQRFGASSIRDIGQDGRRAAFVGFASTLLALEDQPGEIALQPGLRDRIARAFAEKNEGVALIGPQWRLGPDEPDLPSREEYQTNEAQEAEGALAGGSSDG